MDGMSQSPILDAREPKQSQAAAPVRRSRSRSVKIGVASLLLVAGLYAVFSGQGYVASDNAVVSAYTVSVRVPIAGLLSGMHVRVGNDVPLGSVLARVEDERVNDQRLIDLRQSVVRGDAEGAAYASQLEVLTGQRTALLRRAAEHGALVSDYLDHQVEEAERLMEARVARREQARRDLFRRATLARDGFAPVSDVERLNVDHAVADREIAADGARIVNLGSQARASRRGIYVGAGSDDVAYSTQRADEVSIRIAETQRAMAAVIATRDEAAARLAAEERRVGLLRSADLVAPIAGVVWKLGVSDGERLGVGDMVAEIVDCRAGFIIASIPQDRFGDVVIGGTARFKLSGEKLERTGRVLAVTGEASVANDRNLAAAPIAQREAGATVRVAFPPSQGGDCAVGRTARVLLPASGGMPVPAWISRLLPWV